MLDLKNLGPVFIVDQHRTRHSVEMRRADKACDMPAIVEIEAESFPQAWKAEDFARETKDRTRRLWVATWKDFVAGFVLYDLEPMRIHVIDIAVHPRFRRKKVGATMLSHVVSKLGKDSRRRMHLLVRETNVDCQCWLRSCGLRAIKILRCPFEEWDDDGYLFQFLLRRHTAAAC